VEKIFAYLDMYCTEKQGYGLTNDQFSFIRREDRLEFLITLFLKGGSLINQLAHLLQLSIKYDPSLSRKTQ